jgi:hypothetical protein
MKYIFIIIYSILTAYSVTSIKPKLCIDCKFYKRNFLNSKYSKCTALKRVVFDNSFLINGIKIKSVLDYEYCSIARTYNNLCGEDPKLYEKKT